MGILTLAVTGITIWAALEYPVAFQENGILKAGITAETEKSKTLQLTTIMPFEFISMTLFVVANVMWLSKLKTVAKKSPALAAVAAKCLKIMFVQFIIQAMIIVCDFVALDNVENAFDPFCDEEGVAKVRFIHVFYFIEPLCDALLGFSQVWAIKSLNSGSSSSSSSSSASSSSSSTAARTQLQTIKSSSSSSSSSSQLDA